MRRNSGFDQSLLHPFHWTKVTKGSRSEFGAETILGHWRLDTFTISVRERTTQLGFSLLVMFVEIQSKAEEPQADILVTSEHHKKLLNHILEEKNIKNQC